MVAGVKMPLEEPLLGGKKSLAPEIVYAKSTFTSASADIEASASAVTWKLAPRLRILTKCKQ